MVNLNQEVVRFLTLKLFWSEAEDILLNRYAMQTQYLLLPGHPGHHFDLHVADSLGTSNIFSDSYYDFKYKKHCYSLKTKGDK